MKLINEISIWDNGVIKKAFILDAYVVNLILNESATFYYGLFAQNSDGTKGETLSQGNLSMTGQDYTNWLVDNDAWNYIAKCLNLVIIEDYIASTTQTEKL